MSLLKCEYNQLLSRFKKAETYLNSDVPDKDKWLPNFEKIIDRMDEILVELKKSGIKYTSEEVLEGFK